MSPSDSSHTLDLPEARDADAPCPQFPNESLRGWERTAEPLWRWVNSSKAGKWLGMTWLWWTSRIWMRFATWRLWNHSGIEHLKALNADPPPRGILLVSNHRSFFDMFVASTILYWTTGLVRQIYFPVRAKFFYESFTGIVVNWIFAGGAMWPPVFRDSRKAELNPIGLAQMAWVADKPGTLLGIHPEGSRGKGADPHFIQVARPGVGELVKRCHPDMLILPFFIGGLTNDFAYHVGCNIRGEIGDGMRYNFGAPVRAGDFDRNQDAQILADEILDLVRDLRDVDRERLGMPPWVEPDA